MVVKKTAPQPIQYKQVAFPELFKLPLASYISNPLAGTTFQDTNSRLLYNIYKYSLGILFGYVAAAVDLTFGNAARITQYGYRRINPERLPPPKPKSHTSLKVAIASGMIFSLTIGAWYMIKGLGVIEKTPLDVAKNGWDWISSATISSFSWTSRHICSIVSPCDNCPKCDPFEK